MKHLFAALFFLPALLHGQNADINLLKKINVERNTRLDNAFKYFSYSAAPASLAEPATLFAVWMIKKDSVSKANFLTAGFSVGFSAVLSTGIKYAVNRPRCY